ncbi:D-alanine--D-alanine ligase family protein [Schaalia vaccimaxillae]|uniref:D-alanine--D-alanine ligase family protein n=1 Tax=Schaalia vaccimaxillae TaxID=183916 RepID=UPI0003B71C7A|nr:D-alanine--D-alanine ligase family protein [Schaalia vaccimaxillae]
MTQATRPRVLIVFGGRSGEHEVSCATAAGILRAIDRTKWDVLPLGITRDGQWVRVEDDPQAFEFRNGRGQSVQAGATRVALTPGGGSMIEFTYEGDPESPESRIVGAEDLGRIDIVLPLLHGPYGEDGTIQGLFEMADVRYVGCGVTSSAICMDKHLTKTVLAAAGINVGHWELITPSQWELDPQECVDRAAGLGFPVFVKPCRAGSSIGISRVDEAEGLATAIKEARNHDPRVIVEAGVSGREIECGVIGGRDGWQSATAPLGEIEVPEGEFYDYELKYVDTEAIGLVCPADLPQDAATAIRRTALAAFEALECEGLARVDFFYDEETGTILINEVNTMPGFTPISMYPQMWDRGGLDYPRLLDALLEEAASRDLGLR